MSEGGGAKQKHKTYDTEATSVGNSRSEFGVANPLHATLNNRNGDPESLGESCFKGHCFR